jgi:hypothetical protein
MDVGVAGDFHGWWMEFEAVGRCVSLFESRIGPVRRIPRRSSHYSGQLHYDYHVVLETG